MDKITNDLYLVGQYHVGSKQKFHISYLNYSLISPNNSFLESLNVSLTFNNPATFKHFCGLHLLLFPFL